MSTYYDGFFDNIGKMFWPMAGDKTRIVTALNDGVENNRDKWNNMYDTVMPMYQQGVIEGTIPVYTYPTRSTEEWLSGKSSYSKVDVQAFLRTIQSLAEQGHITMSQLNPVGARKTEAKKDTPERIVTGAARTTDKAIDYAGKKLKAVAEVTAETGSKLFWPLAIGALAIAAVIVAPRVLSKKR